jgi:uncharacterized protein (DUF885 family)
MSGRGGHDADAVEPSALVPVAEAALAARLDHDPVEATYLGDHTRDGRLPAVGPEAATDRLAVIRTQLAELDALEPASLPPEDAVDAAVLRNALAAELLDLDDIREAEWNPMLYNPGGGVHSLISRDFAPLPVRLAALTQRLQAVPEYLADARRRLSTMSRIHLETASNQLAGTVAMLETELPHDADAGLREAAQVARAALLEHGTWLADQAGRATRDPRLGESLFAAKLTLTLDTATDPQALLARAEADLDAVRERIVDAAGPLAGASRPTPDAVREVLDDLAREAPTDETILPLCREALDRTTEFVRAHDLVTVYDDPVLVVEMPEIDRGVAGAYCRENGPLEQAVLPTEFAVSPTPADWTDAQKASFFREYNAHMLHNLTVHEAMPGHALQLMHARRHRGSTPVRAVWSSGSFIEGWAVYSEELMADRGYRRDVSERAAAALRMQQLKMQLRTIINTILDIRYHCGDLDERAAVELMSRRGFQEEGEILGKWRRVQLTSTQLCTYYVGCTELRDLSDDLRAARPQWSDQQVHDAMLAHGSPPARHLRTLLGLATV